ncbi:hypothetical protein GHT06_008302 [Daphnia sinensis]|uniref:t-SNARE coiled-coil homology domain-containing protein n=1 Tax=Daphnia sinensis TaxID=1820382 RepID=A0AAD5LLN7_9CRUS|nr:hypothetical protein GHT06_008302 [Daphnia sinensis]
MITRRRRQGSESEHQPFAEPQLQNQVLKGPSSVLLWSGESPQQQPSFFIVPQGEIGAFAAPSFSANKSLDVQTKTNSTDMMALAANSSSALLSSTNASSRDRTAEFLSAVRSFQNRPANGVVGRPNQQLSRNNDQQHQQYSEFMKVAKVISKDLSNTYAKLEKLTLLAKKRTLFDDRPQEIQELTYIIREDITNLNKQIAHLQGFMKKHQSHQQNTKAHSANVVVALQSKLANMSSEFKQVLEVRTENLKAQRTRREQFSGTAPVVSDLPAAALTGGPFGSSQNGSKGSVLLRDAYQAHGGEAVAIDMGAADHRTTRTQVQQQVFADETESYLQSRSDAVQSIESTIVELGGIFQQLALMVREQEEMVQRIDSNVDDAQLNVEAAHDELLRYFRSVSSNRWLMLKVFGVVLVFILIFAVFFA